MQCPAQSYCRNWVVPRRAAAWSCQFLEIGVYYGGTQLHTLQYCHARGGVRYKLRASFVNLRANAMSRYLDISWKCLEWNRACTTCMHICRTRATINRSFGVICTICVSHYIWAYKLKGTGMQICITHRLNVCQQSMLPLHVLSTRLSIILMAPLCSATTETLKN